MHINDKFFRIAGNASLFGLQFVGLIMLLLFLGSFLIQKIDGYFFPHLIFDAIIINPLFFIEDVVGILIINFKRFSIFFC